MTVAEHIKSRISTRAFLDRPVSEETIRALLEIARWAPSGGNLQPWRVHVLMGAGRERFAAFIKKTIAENPFANESEHAVYPPQLCEPYRTRRYEVGEAMYQLLGIPRENKTERIMHLAKNYEFFGAPVGLFFSIDRMFDRGQWAHMGMFMQTLALAAEEKGLATCMQEAWMMRAKTVSEYLNLEEGEQLYCGMALGYADPEAQVNRLRSERAAVEEFATFITE